MQTTVQNQNSG